MSSGTRYPPRPPISSAGTTNVARSTSAATKRSPMVATPFRPTTATMDGKPRVRYGTMARERVSSAHLATPLQQQDSTTYGSRNIQFDGVPEEVRGVLMNTVFTDLVKTVEDQRQQYASAVVQYEAAYMEMLQSTQQLPVPNPLRTVTSCFLLDRILDIVRPTHTSVTATNTLDAQTPLIDRLKADVFAAVFSGTTADDFVEALPPGPSGPTSLLEYQPYFSALDRMERKHMQTIADFTGQNSASEKQQLVLERVINRWQSMLVDRLFNAWRNHIKRNKNHEKAIVRLVKRHTRKEYLMWGFYSWRYNAMSGIQEDLRRNIVHINEIRVKEHQMFNDESSQLLQTIETLKEEKLQLAEQTRRAQDEASSAKLTAEQLQTRFEQQRATAQSWKEMAVSLVSAVSPAKPELDLPKHKLFSLSDTVNPRLVAWDPAAVKDFSAERLVLYWVSTAVREEEANLGINDEAVGSLHDFEDDFKSGRVITLVASYVEAIKRSEVYNILTKNPTVQLNDVLPRLKVWVDYDLPLSPIDVCAGHPTMTYFLMSLVMEKHHMYRMSPTTVERKIINPLKYGYGFQAAAAPSKRSAKSKGSSKGNSPVDNPTESFPNQDDDHPSSNGTLATANLGGGSIDTISLADLKTKLQQVAEHQHDWNMAVQNCRRHMVELMAKSSNVVDQSTVDAVVDRALLAKVLSERNKVDMSDAAGDVILIEVTDQVALHATELREVFATYSTTKTGMTHSKFNRFLADTKLINKQFPKKNAASLFDYLLNASKTAKHPPKSPPPVDSPHEEGTLKRKSTFTSLDSKKESNDQHLTFDESNMASGAEDRSQTSLSQQQWVGALVHLAFLRDDNNSLSPSKKITTIVSHIQQLAKDSGLDEFRDACYGKQVQDVFAKNNTLLSRIFEAAAGADDDPEMSFDEFLQVVKDAKLIDHNLSIDVCKRLFEFTQDAPWQHASMVYRDFLEAIVALSVFKIPSPWLPLAERVKQFLKENFLPPFVKKLKEKKR